MPGDLFDIVCNKHAFPSGHDIAIVASVREVDPNSTIRNDEDRGDGVCTRVVTMCRESHDGFIPQWEVWECHIATGMAKGHWVRIVEAHR